jgi:hypothetical protein
MLGGGDITCFVATAVFYKKIEDDIIITCNVNNNNKTIKRGTGFFVVENILDDPSRENIVSKFYKKHVIIKT